MKASDLSIGLIVYSYNDPRHVVVPENSPVWECRVTGWRIFSTVKEFDEDEEEVDVFLDNGFSTSRRSLSDVFASLEEAREYGKVEMHRLLEKNLEWRSKLEEALGALIDQKSGQ